MSREPVRLLSRDGGASAFERSVLRAGLDVGPPSDAKDAVWAEMMKHVPPDGGGPDVGGPDAAAGGALAGSAFAAWWKGAAIGTAVALLAVGGFHASQSTTSQSSPAPTVAQPTAASKLSAPAVQLPHEPSQSSATAEVAEEPPAKRRAQRGSATSLAAAPVLQDAESGGAATGELTTASAALPDPPPAAPVARATQLKEEARLVREARAALRARDPSRAQAILGQLDREHPRGALGQEREALAIEALWLGGSRAVARARASAFVARFPNSPHASRIRSFADVP